MQTVAFARVVILALSLGASHAGAGPVLEQETITIKGNQGLPNTLYIAPWKRVGEPLESAPLEGEIREETEPVERDLFRRELELQRRGYSVD